MIDGTTSAPGNVQLVGQPHLITDARIDCEMPEGLTVGEILDRSGLDIRLARWTHVDIDGQELAPIWWDRVKPKAGHVVTARVWPTGGGAGGGGEDSNKIARTVLQIVVYVAAAVLSYFFPLYTPLFFMGASAITVALQFLLPPSFPKIKSQEGATVSPSIAGVRNEARPFGVVPRIMGRHRTFPPANPRYATRFHSVAA
jgi:hypothetical protein